MKKFKFITKLMIVGGIAVAFIIGVRKGFQDGFLNGVNLKGC